jgi:hypothetical protein
MASIHFICRDRANLHPVGHPIYDSGDWDITVEDAARLTGGMIFLHQAKAQLSYFGGVIESHRLTETGNAHSQRVVFRFTFVPEGKDVKWRGADHDRAWTSGIVGD